MDGDRPGPPARAGTEPPPRPRRLARRYRLLSVVGSGGMGTVWRARDEVLHRDVAVKEVRVPARATEGERRILRRRLLGEARATAALRHPGVVTVHDVVVEDGRPWIVMEYVESRSLAQVVREGGPLGTRRAAEIGGAVLSVLRAAHAAGILHRDVKPSNVLVCADGRVLLTDFGLAAPLPGEDDRGDTLVAGIEGTPAYLPPERVRGRPGGEASDLWSLGATLYLAVEGTPPFLRGHALASMVAVLLGEYARPVRAGALAPVIEGLLRQDPGDRLSADAAARLLRDAARGERRRRRSRRRLRPAAVPAVAMLATGAVGLGTWAARWTSVGQSEPPVLERASGAQRMTLYSEAGAYSVRVPAGWRSERRGTAMIWEDRESGRGLRIVPAPGDPLAGLRGAERRALAERLYPGYHRLRMEPAPELVEGAAEWEFTWDGDRGSGRHVLRGRVAGYEFSFHAPGDQWTPSRRLYDRVVRSFTPETGR